MSTNRVAMNRNENWFPLQRLFGPRAAEFMCMGAAWCGAQMIYSYKHQVTRRYIHLVFLGDGKGPGGSDYAPAPLRDALRAWNEDAETMDVAPLVPGVYAPCATGLAEPREQPPDALLLWARAGERAAHWQSVAFYAANEADRLLSDDGPAPARERIAGAAERMAERASRLNAAWLAVAAAYRERTGDPAALQARAEGMELEARAEL